MANKKNREWVEPEFDKLGMTQWGWRVSHRENFKLGEDVEIGTFTMIDARHGVEIESGVKIGFGCSILSHSSIDKKSGQVVLRRGCKLGANSVVMPGIEIGENAVVGANSFVNRNIPPGEVWVGSPVRFYKKGIDSYL
jgi:acetyltransferase-like isoleucine patch superfamily enzyme